MMPVIRINDATFSDLSALKTWFGTKSPSDTIDRVVQEVMEQLGMERDEEVEESAAIATAGDGVMHFERAPSLTLAKPLAASINGKAIQNPNWATILHAMITQVKAKGIEGEKLVRELAIPARAAKFEEKGFKYQTDLGISIQGQSAADAWKEVDRLAKKWRIPVTVEFMWRQNPKAQYPGRNGVLRSGQ